MSSHAIYILLVQVNFFAIKKTVHLILCIHDQKAYVLPCVNACLANFECKISKFIFKFKHPNSVETMKENKNCSLVGEESFLLFWTNYDFILTTKNNFSPFIWPWRHQITVSVELIPNNVKHVDKYFYRFSLRLNKK